MSARRLEGQPVADAIRAGRQEMRRQVAPEAHGKPDQHADEYDDRAVEDDLPCVDAGCRAHQRSAQAPAGCPRRSKCRTGGITMLARGHQEGAESMDFSTLP